MNDKDSLEFLDILTILSFIVSLQNLDLNQKQVSNVMAELQDNQNSMLKTIINQNEQIIKLIKELQYAQSSNSSNN
jgi:hypothetical protein